MINKLYEDYGKLMINKEILDRQIGDTKAKIVQCINQAQEANNTARIKGLKEQPKAKEEKKKEPVK